MTLIIKIESSKLITKSGISQKTGKPYEIREQSALMFKSGESYPDKIKISLRDGQAAYSPGDYTLDDSSFYPSRFGGVEVTPVLVAYAPPPKQAAS